MENIGADQSTSFRAISSLNSMLSQNNFSSAAIISFILRSVKWRQDSDGAEAEAEAENDKVDAVDKSFVKQIWVMILQRI